MKENEQKRLKERERVIERERETEREMEREIEKEREKENACWPKIACYQCSCLKPIFFWTHTEPKFGFRMQNYHKQSNLVEDFA